MPAQHTTVVIMLFVTTSGDPITARARMDFMEMDLTALVTIATCFNFMTVNGKLLNYTTHTTRYK